ncbi:MAG: oligosaccharide flippase family protein [Candidatus Omnitrophota bacterium]
MSSRAKKIVHGSMLGACNFFANAVAGLVLMPFIVHALGDRMYGLWMVVGSILGYYGFFDFGLVFAVQRYISQAIGREDYKETNKFVNTSFYLYAVIGFIVLLLLVTGALVAPFFIKNVAEIDLFRKILVILGLSVAIGFPMRVFSAVLISHIRYDLYNIIELIKIAARVILVIFFLKTGHGILALALINFGIEMCGYLIKFILVKSIFKYITFSRKYIEMGKIKPLFKFSFFSFVIQIVDRFRLDISNFVIAGFLGLAYVTLYSVSSNLIRYFNQLIINTVSLLLPVFSQYEGKGDYDSIREKYILSVKISGYLSTLIGGTMILFGRVFIERWMGKDYLAAYPILVVLVISTVFSSIQSPSWGLLYGISKHRFLAIANTVEGFISFFMALILVRKFGLMGVALGSAIPMIVLKVMIQPVYVCRVIKIGVSEFYFKILLPIVLKSSVFFLILWHVLKGFMVPNYFNIVPLIICECAIISTFILFFGFNSIERKYFRKIILGY